jgi:predicted acetyltransferase
MIRQAERKDITQLAELWARAFPGERTVAQRIAQMEMGGVFGGVETAWIAERAGNMVGAFRAYSLTQHMHGAAYGMMGLAAVAVDETARRRGVGRELCEHAIRIARDRGDTLSVLYPFRPAFYHALGWGLVGELHTYRFRPESLLARGSGDVRRATADDSAAIAACYAEVAHAGNGMIRRTPRIWRLHLDTDVTTTYVTGEDDVAGYIIVRFGRSGSPDERPMYVRELVASDASAYETLLGWIAAQRDAWRAVIYEATPDEHFAHRLADPRPPGFHNTRNLWAPIARVVRGPMLRVLDLPRALEERRRWGASVPLRFGLAIEDGLVPENAGPFVVEFDGCRATVTRGSAAPLLRTTAPAFAQVFAGELRVVEALRLGVAEAEGDVGTIDALFRTDSCFRLLDEF